MSSLIKRKTRNSSLSWEDTVGKPKNLTFCSNIRARKRRADDICSRKLRRRRSCLSFIFEAGNREYCKLSPSWTGWNFLVNSSPLSPSSCKQIICDCLSGLLTISESFQYYEEYPNRLNTNLFPIIRKWWKYFYQSWKSLLQYRVSSTTSSCGYDRKTEHLSEKLHQIRKGSTTFKTLRMTRWKYLRT